MVVRDHIYFSLTGLPDLVSSNSLMFSPLAFDVSVPHTRNCTEY